MILDKDKIVVTTEYIFDKNIDISIATTCRCYDNKATILTYTTNVLNEAYYVYENGSIFSPDKNNPTIDTDMLVSFDNPFDAYNYFQEVLDSQNEQEQEEQKKKDQRIPFIRVNTNGNGRVYTCDGNFENIQDETQDITLGTFDINAPAQKDISITIGNETKEGILIKYPPLNASNDEQAFFFMIGDPSPNDPPPPQDEPKQMLFLSDEEMTEINTYNGQFYELVDGKLENTNQDSFVLVTELDPKLVGVVEGQEATLIRMPNYDEDGKFAYAFSTEDEEPKQMLFLTDNEITILDAYQGQFYELIDGKLENTNQDSFVFVTELTPKIVGAIENKEATLTRMPNFDQDGKFAYALSDDDAEPKKVVFLTANEMVAINPYNGTFYEVDNDGNLTNTNQNGVAIISELNPLKGSMMGKDLIFVRKPNYDTDGLFAYEFAEDKEPEELVFLSDREITSVTNYNGQIYKVENGVVTEFKSNFIVNVIDVTNDIKIKMNGEDVLLIRTPLLDANGKIAYKFAIENDEDEKQKFFSSIVEINTNGNFILDVYELDDNDNLINLNKSISIQITDMTQSSMLGVIQGEEVKVSLDYDMTNDVAKNPNHYFFYNIYKEGKGGDITPNSSGGQGNSSTTSNSDILNIISNVSGLNVNKVYSYFERNLNMAELFLQNINFVELQKQLNTNETRRELAKRINQAIKDDLITID
jgi:hypothetical protein